ncbi:type II and III secretion system protein family protein [uncultured Porticoccus sp.]|uniref:type II and III secretion system protein family protein n=1 Tax=uncultured Porticoccus sp. TaxID=1256050 RepID=UPI00260E3C5D|nr:type II and III secretion system protein family protein [uncultured Porticoccus sp.]
MPIALDSHRTFFFAVIAVWLLGSSHVEASCSDAVMFPSVLEMLPGAQREVDIGQPIQRLAIADPNLADVQLTSKQAFLITSKQSGVSNVSVWTGCQIEPLQALLYVVGQASAALQDPVAQRRSNTPVLPSQVQTDIRFVEVNRTKMKEVGISLFGTTSNNFLFGSPGASPGSVSPGNVSGVVGNVPLSDTGFNIVWGGGSRKVLGALNALENSGFAYTLARPSLVALSGQSASFLAGGEFPVPVPNSASDSVSIEYKEFGVRLGLTPTVVGPNRITLKVAPEVSELDFTNGITIEGTTVPALSVRRTDTSISLASGESFVISGLISMTNMSSVSKLPGLGDLPVLGAFFRSSRIEREERELLMIVTPYLVQPMAAGAELPELPGEELKNYDPSLFELLFYEKGDFLQPAGLSR